MTISLSILNKILFSNACDFSKCKIKWNIIQTPMFLNSRSEFKNYLNKSKKPFMAVFYKETRKKLKILIANCKRGNIPN